MLKEDVLKKLTDCGLVAVVRANNAEEAIKIQTLALQAVVQVSNLHLQFRVPTRLLLLWLKNIQTAK